MFHKQKDRIFTGIPEITEEMLTDEFIGNVRNSVIHRYRRVESGDIVVIDGKNESNLSEKTRFNLKRFMNFIRGKCLIPKIKVNIRNDGQQQI